MTDMRFRSLLKSRRASTSYVVSFPNSLMVMESCVRDRNTKPKQRAAVTKAPSSGDAAWYTSSPEKERHHRYNQTHHSHFHKYLT